MALSLIFTWNWYFYWLLHEIGTFIDFYIKLVLLLTFTWNWYFYWLLHEIGYDFDGVPISGNRRDVEGIIFEYVLGENNHYNVGVYKIYYFIVSCIWIVSISRNYLPFVGTCVLSIWKFTGYRSIKSCAHNCIEYLTTSSNN
jgi:hypothetical protein